MRIRVLAIIGLIVVTASVTACTVEGTPRIVAADRSIASSTTTSEATSSTPAQLPTGSSKSIYLQVVRGDGDFASESDEALLAAGAQVCDDLRSNVPFFTVLDRVSIAHGSVELAARLAGSAAGSLCSDQLEKIHP